MQQKIVFAHVELNMLLMLTYYYLWSLHLVYSPKFELSLTFVTVTELITIPFLQFNILKKIATLLIFLLQGVSVETAISVEGGRKHLLLRSRCGQK